MDLKNTNIFVSVGSPDYDFLTGFLFKWSNIFLAIRIILI